MTKTGDWEPWLRKSQLFTILISTSLNGRQIKSLRQGEKLRFCSLLDNVVVHALDFQNEFILLLIPIQSQFMADVVKKYPIST